MSDNRPVLTEVKWNRSVVSNSLRPHGLQPTRLLCPWDFLGMSTGVGCHFLLQGIFPAQGSNQVSRIVGRRFTVWVTREALLPSSQFIPFWKIMWFKIIFMIYKWGGVSLPIYLGWIYLPKRVRIVYTFVLQKLCKIKSCPWWNVSNEFILLNVILGFVL